jgi:hypothetical protein
MAIVRMVLPVNLLEEHIQIIFLEITTHSIQGPSTGMAENMGKRLLQLTHMHRMVPMEEGDMEHLQDLVEVDLAEAGQAEGMVPLKILKGKVVDMELHHRTLTLQTLASLGPQLVDMAVLSQVANTRIIQTAPNDHSLHSPKDNTLPTLHVHLILDGATQIEPTQATTTNNRDAWHPRH